MNPVHFYFNFQKEQILGYLIFEFQVLTTFPLRVTAKNI